MKKIGVVAGVIGASLVLAACAGIPRPGPVGNARVPEPAKAVNIQDYMGRWYEQFRYDASFQKDMDAVSADYSLKDDGTVRVVNSGRKNGLADPVKTSVGKAKVVDTATNAKLKVSFFGPFYGDYWILDHGDRYEWSIVGEPSGRYLWALTRDAKPGAETLAMLQDRVRKMGYDWSLVRVTEQ
ncbi:MAG: lipocalin [Sphingomonadales bacterium]|nr:MAG: lipocalin [Sphingomonadales bacterium]